MWNCEMAGWDEAGSDFKEGLRAGKTDMRTLSGICVVVCALLVAVGVAVAQEGAQTPKPDTRPAETQAVDLRPADLRPADLRPADLGPADLGPADLGPADQRAVEKEISKVGEQLAGALEKLDGDAVAALLTADVVVIQPDGTTLEGPKAVKDFLATCKAGTGGWFKGVTMTPEIKTREVKGAQALVTGLTHDKYTMVDGSEIQMDSRFSAVLQKNGDVWQIRQLQAAPAGFDNPMMLAVLSKSANALVWAWVIGVSMGAFIATLITRHFMKKG
jgi:ketosteroid isomerase-like protein